jgi:hypothetical protein
MVLDYPGLEADYLSGHQGGFAPNATLVEPEVIGESFAAAGVANITKQNSRVDVRARSSRPGSDINGDDLKRLPNSCAKCISGWCE